MARLYKEKKKSLITREELFKTLKYSNTSGKFYWKIRPSQAVKVGDVFGHTEADGYVRGNIKRVRYQIHHLVFLYKTGKYPTDVIDHIDGVRDNNIWSNLRLATKTQNQCNRKNTNGKTLPKGICKRVKPDGSIYFTAAIKLDKITLTKSYSLTRFRTETGIVTGLQNWLISKREPLHGEFANHG